MANRLLTFKEFARSVQTTMEKAEDDAGLLRGSLITAYIKSFNRRSDGSRCKHRNKEWISESRQGTHTSWCCSCGALFIQKEDRKEKIHRVIVQP